MFTGIIEATGRISAIREQGGDWRLSIDSAKLDFSDVRTGDSIAVSGVCLTALDIHAKGFSADVSRETLAVTTLATLKVGAEVNLEKALMPQSRLGGHIVSGHVDGIAELISRRPDGRSERLTFQLPQALTRYVAHKGSICIDGVSLTVNEVQDREFGVNIIPHTMDRTTLHEYRAGRRVNIEVDVISRYLERLLQDRGEAGGLTLEQLSRAGFAPR
jgi:riboflavin synthase